MEETVVLKLETYNDMKRQIAFMEEGMMSALNASIEANKELVRKQNAYRFMVEEYIASNTYTIYDGFFRSTEDKLKEAGIFDEINAIRIGMFNKKEEEKQAESDAIDKKNMEDAENQALESSVYAEIKKKEGNE